MELNSLAAWSCGNIRMGLCISVKEYCKYGGVDGVGVVPAKKLTVNSNAL